MLLINYIKALFTILGKAPDLFTHKLTSTRCRNENHRFYPSFEYKQNKFKKMNYVIYPLIRLGESAFMNWSSIPGFIFEQTGAGGTVEDEPGSRRSVMGGVLLY